MSTEVKEGTLWRSSDDKRFRVLGVVMTGSDVWVHYREELTGYAQSGAKEFSCFKESFVERFSPTPE